MTEKDIQILKDNGFTSENSGLKPDSGIQWVKFSGDQEMYIKEEDGKIKHTFCLNVQDEDGNEVEEESFMEEKSLESVDIYWFDQW